MVRMLGVIAGDIIGSVYEHHPRKSTRIRMLHPHSRYTDDTVLTCATAHAILTGVPYEVAYREFGRRHPDAGYGGSFMQWLWSPNPAPYNSWGNGSAMRVAPVGWAFDSVDAVLAEAAKSALVTHDHPEGTRGAQAVALAVYLARTGVPKEGIREEISGRFGYDLDRTVAEIRPSYRFDVSCQGSVPEALIAFLDSTSWEEAVRLAVSLGGDADTQAAIAGGVGEAFYGGVAEVEGWVMGKLAGDLRDVLIAFGDGRRRWQRV